MLDLGYNEYVSQGGDWGSMITRIMGQHHADHLKGIHVNLAAFKPGNLLKMPYLFLLALLPPYWPTKRQRDGLARGQEYTADGNAYYQMQRTRPQTVAYCLADSPVALLGWVYEKLLHWTDAYPWTPDEILTWISIYWFSRAGPGASVRTYFEATDRSPEWHAPTPNTDEFWEYTTPVLGLSQFPRDIVNVPRFVARTLGSIVFERYHDQGGHFASWERPEELAADVQAMYGPGGGAHGCVKSLS